MDDIKQCLQEAIKSIEDTTGSFYQNRISEGYKKLEYTLGALDDLMYKIAAFRQQGNDIRIDDNRMNQILMEAMKALETKDVVLLSDILEYEVKEMLVQCREGLL